MKKAIALILCFLFSCLSPALAEGGLSTVELRGSGTVMGVLQRAAEAYMQTHPETTVSITGGGTDRAIKSLIDGTCDIAMASAEPNDVLTLMAAQKHVTLTGQIIAFDAIVLFVNPANALENLTITQLRDIYSGAIVNWKDVGGTDLPILLVSRDKTSGTFEGFKHLVLGDDAILPASALEMDSAGAREYVSENPGAIGFASFSSVDRTVKPLSVDGVAPSEDSIRSRSFPLTRSLMLYFRSDADEATKAFLKYVMDGIETFAGSGIYPAS